MEEMERVYSTEGLDLPVATENGAQNSRNLKLRDGWQNKGELRFCWQPGTLLNSCGTMRTWDTFVADANRRLPMMGGV